MPDVPQEAVTVLKSFLDAMQRSDMAGMTACITRKSLESAQFSGPPEGVRFVMGDGQMEDGQAIIMLKGYPLDAPADGEPMMQMPTVLVQEDGQWKVDINATTDRMMGGAMQDAMEQIADGMSQAVDAVGAAMSDAFGGSTPSGEDDPSWDQADLSLQADELFPLGELTRLPQTTLRVTYALGFDVPVELKSGERPKNMSEQEKADLLTQMINWYDSSFFTEWQALFEGVCASGVPLRNRLRSIRIEEAKSSDDRIVVLDGSDLVYHIDPTREDGYFSTEQLAAMLPAILAGLPARMDDATADHRSLPLAGEYPSIDSYRQKWVPRWMRRIRELIGAPVRLEVDWREAENATNVGPQLPRWGLNRVYGALAFACMDEARKEQLKQTLKTIQLDVGSSVYKKSAKYEEGKLTLGLCYFGGDTPGCHEHEIAGALAGQPVK